MQANDAARFREGISGVMGFYEKTIAPFAFDVWWNALKAYELPAVIDAFNRHLSNADTGQFAPKPADIIRMLQGSTQDSALRAWAKVDQAVRQVGTYTDVVFDDALIHRVIQDMGGWISFGMKDDDEWPFVSKEFENRYRGFKIRSETPEYPSILIGIATAQNSQQGIRSEPPVLIGNELRALQVMQGGTDKPSIAFKRMSEDMKPVKQLRAVC